MTDRAKQVIKLIDSDVGRPIGDLASNLQYDALSEDAAHVLRTLQPRQAIYPLHQCVVRSVLNPIPG